MMYGQMMRRSGSLAATEIQPVNVTPSTTSELIPASQSLAISKPRLLRTNYYNLKGEGHPLRKITGNGGGAIKGRLIKSNRKVA